MRVYGIDPVTSNRAKGRHSYDATVGNSLVEFINRSATPYPVDVGGPSFEPVPVQSQKDLMVNAARMYVRQEYDRIMELVAVLQRQAADIAHRLDITDQVRQAKYDFKLYHGQYYWLVWDNKHQITRLCHIGPTDWNTGKPDEYDYIAHIQWLGDNTFREVDSDQP